MNFLKGPPTPGTVELIAVSLKTMMECGIRIECREGTEESIAHVDYVNGKWEIVIDQGAAMGADANEGNALALLHCLWHEFGHIYLSSFNLVPPPIPGFDNIPEEMWCDEFASMMCDEMGAEIVGEPYLQDWR